MVLAGCYIVTTGMQAYILRYFHEELYTHQATAWCNADLNINLYSIISSVTNSLYNLEQVFKLL